MDAPYGTNSISWMRGKRRTGVHDATSLDLFLLLFNGSTRSDCGGMGILSTRLTSDCLLVNLLRG